MSLFKSENGERKGFAQKIATMVALLLVFAAGLATALWIGRAQAAPAAAPTTDLAQQIAGKSGLPVTMSPDSIPPDYRLIGLIDAQSKSGFYVTRGEILSSGSDSFLLAYEVTIFNDEAGEQKIARGDSLMLSLINLHNVEIISHIGPLPGVATPPPPARQP